MKTTVADQDGELIPITCTTCLQTGLMGGVLGMAWCLANGSTPGRMAMSGPENNVKRAVKDDQVAKDMSLSDLVVS
jgi:hypothetical protein